MVDLRGFQALVRRFLFALPLLLLLPLAACSATLAPRAQSAELPGQVRVVVDRVKGDTIWLLVYNLTNAPLTVDRDAIRLESRGKTFDRDRGMFGLASRRFHQLPPGGVHDVRLEYELGGADSGDAMLYLDQAIVVGGRPLPVPPIPFQMR